MRTLTVTSAGLHVPFITVTTPVFTRLHHLTTSKCQLNRLLLLGPPVRDQPRQAGRDPVVPAHARQGAQLRQGPLPHGQRDPQPTTAAQAQRALHTDRCAQDPGHGAGL